MRNFLWVRCWVSSGDEQSVASGSGNWLFIIVWATKWSKIDGTKIQDKKWDKKQVKIAAKYGTQNETKKLQITGQKIEQNTGQIYDNEMTKMERSTRQ